MRLREGELLKKIVFEHLLLVEFPLSLVVVLADLE